jgi:hypothetical protein
MTKAWDTVVEATLGAQERFDKISPGRLFRNKKYGMAVGGPFGPRRRLRRAAWGFTKR